MGGATSYIRHQNGPGRATAACSALCADSSAKFCSFCDRETNAPSSGFALGSDDDDDDVPPSPCVAIEIGWGVPLVLPS